MLHGEQKIEIHRPIPTAAQTETQSRIKAIYDKGKAALIVIETETSEKGGAPLFTNTTAIFARGEGGFGGDPGPKPGNDAPERAPDLVVESPTAPQQALLYRLNGDKNPLHIDPEFAKMGGFDMPILHGLCSYGVVCKAVVDHALDGDVDRVAALRGALRRCGLPGRDDRHLDVARGRQDPALREDRGARLAGARQRGDHAALRRSAPRAGASRTGSERAGVLDRRERAPERIDVAPDNVALGVGDRERRLRRR